MSHFVFDFFNKEYRAYQSFDSVQAMEDSLRLFLRENFYELSDSTKAIIKYLLKMSKHVIGVSWMNAATIATKLGITTRTVDRCLNSLIGHGVLEKHPRTHPKGGRRFLLVLKPYGSKMAATPSTDHQGSANGDTIICKNVGLNVELDVRLVEREKGVENTDVARVSANSTTSSNSSSLNKDLKSFKDKTNVSNAVPIFHSDFVDKFLKKGIPTFFQRITAGLRPTEMQDAWNRAQMAAKATGCKLPIPALIEQAWHVTKDSMKRDAIECGDFRPFFYGVLLKLYKALEIDMLLNDFKQHSEVFYEVNSRSTQRFRHSKPFITRAKEKFVRLIMNRNGITYDEAAERYFAGE